MPSLRQLELFRLMMRTRHVTETARLLRISQPAASQSLREMETELGLELFVRAGGRLRPTAEARQLLPAIERVFSHHAALDSLATELRDVQAGRLVLATIPTLTGWLLPRTIGAFLQERARVRIQLDTRDTPGVVAAIRRDDADLGLIYAPIDDPAVAAEPLFRTALVAMMRPDHPLAARTTVDVAALAAHPTITMHGSNPPGPLLAESIRQSRVPFEPALETNLSFAAATLVQEGMGVFVADPLILLTRLADGLVARPFVPTVEFTLCAIYARQRPVPRLVVRFVATLRDKLGDMAAELRRRNLPGTVL